MEQESDNNIIVKCFDSSYTTVSQDAQNIITRLIPPESFKLQLDIMATPKQSGTTDCGVYAIAVSTSLAFHQNPCLQVYNQADMRSHLIECLAKQKMIPFPIKQKRRINVLVKSTLVIYVCPACRKAEDPNSEEMVGCDKCSNWWHDSCLTSAYNIQPWYCQCVPQ